MHLLLPTLRHNNGARGVISKQVSTYGGVFTDTSATEGLRLRVG